MAGAKAYIEQKNWGRSLRSLHDGASYAHAVVAVASGANMNFERLRLVAERVMVGEGPEPLFLVTLPEERGSFRSLCELIGSHNVTEFSYRMRLGAVARVLIGVQIEQASEGPAIGEAICLAGGGALGDERLFRFEFPERSGSLMRFLRQLNPAWNISLFHYRYSGGEIGYVLVGLQVPDQDTLALGTFLTFLGYRYVDETSSTVYQAMLGNRAYCE